QEPQAKSEPMATQITKAKATTKAEPTTQEPTQETFDILKIDKNISDEQVETLLKEIEDKNLKVNLPLRDEEALGKAFQKDELGYGRKRLLNLALNEQFLKRHKGFIESAEKTQSKAEFQKFLKENKAEVVEYIKDMVTNTLRYIDAYGEGYHFTNTSSLRRANEMILNLESGKNFYFYNHAPNKITNPAPKSHYADKLVDGNEAIQGTYKISDEIKQDLIKSLKEFVGSRQNLAENIADMQSRWWHKIKEQERLAPSILEGGKKANNGYDENLKKALEHEVYLFNQFERKIVKNPQKTSSDLELANNYYRFSKGDTYTKKALDEINQTRQILEQELNIQPIKEFGTNYAEFYHDGENAIKKLLTERQGQVVGAFEREELGDIDLVWGNEKMGLAHILSRRSEQWGEEKAIRFINHLAENIEKGTINAGKNGRTQINTELTTIVIDKNKDNRFILTAYRDKNNKKMSLENAKLVQSSTITDKGIETNAKDSSVLSSNQQPNSTPKEIKSQEPTTQPMMNGFSTMAMQKAILHLGSGGIGGVMNANAEQDPDKKAEAFVKGFLLGAGGSVGAMKMLENSAKLAPQLAQVSQRLAKDLPMILNDRPDIVGKALGKTPKENYNYIFGGENAIGANKAKLKTAVEMAKNGADESEIWAKTGWYKDIDKKWKFEINPKGGELDISALKKATPNKLGDILKDDELFKTYPQVKDLSILPTQTKDGANAIYHEAFGSRQKAIFFDYDYLQNATNDELKSTLYHEI
ncbi:LPD23 domain-containing protein, partial [Campylobacter lanienae]|uniref:LPD23 domain-containing protein n=1 Tax=Campylobacter lanienae TaxID=75658 RepID=UPI0029EB0772|nr:hypothetical protein [Campylobacter lanienae]